MYIAHNIISKIHPHTKYCHWFYLNFYFELFFFLCICAHFHYGKIIETIVALTNEKCELHIEKELNDE